MSLTKQLLMDRARWKLLILLMALISGVLGLTGPIFQKAFIDSLTKSHQGGVDMGRSFHDLWMFFICVIISVATQLYAGYLGQREANWVQEDLGGRIYKQMLRLKSGQLAGTQVGEIVSLYTVDAALDILTRAEQAARAADARIGGASIERFGQTTLRLAIVNSRGVAVSSRAS